jgi:hypothetical protein
MITSGKLIGKADVHGVRNAGLSTVFGFGVDDVGVSLRGGIQEQNDDKAAIANPCRLYTRWKSSLGSWPRLAQTVRLSSGD